MSHKSMTMETGEACLLYSRRSGVLREAAARAKRKEDCSPRPVEQYAFKRRPPMGRRLPTSF